VTAARTDPATRHPATGLEEQVFQALLLAADHLLRGEVDVLRTADLTFPQYNVLRILRGAGPDPLSCGSIAQRMLNRDSDLTRLLDRLEERGLVRRGRESSDRRVVTARITKAGLDLLRRLDEPVRRVHQEQLQHMTKTELTALRRAAARVRVGG
jgi:MarR family transcriptional regulator, organic hydroperoxide resistance regulator